MKKYIVKVLYHNHYKMAGGGDLIWFVKAKNDRDLEALINKEYQDSLDLIEGYEYEEIKHYMFKRHDIYPVVGNWVGAECMRISEAPTTSGATE